ncbi:T9SS type A sorting domain-containing protein [candidate division WOR-3 bacterium]|nr:T9SS type A sorting domain-containing protein [candidate division WOR-3 bacterium]
MKRFVATFVYLCVLSIAFVSADPLEAAPQIHDVGVTRILSPPEGGIPPGTYDFTARIQNLGDYVESFDIVANIWDTVCMVPIFIGYHTISDFPAGADTALQFASDIFFIPMEAYVGEVIILISDNNPANDTAYTNYFVPESLGQLIYWIDAQTPTGSMALHGVEFDGEYFYLTGMTAINETKIFVLDTLGNLMWTINQPAHCTGWGWRDMAFDRVHVGPDRIDTLYASYTAEVDRFGINKAAGTLDYYGSFQGATDPNRSLAYLPESLYFFTADMLNIYKFMKDGPILYQDTTPWVMRGAAYDHDTLGGGSVWWSSLDSADQIKEYDPNALCFTGTSFGCDYPASGLGFAQDFRDMDVLFAVVNDPQADHIYGFFLRWGDSTGVREHTPSIRHTEFGFVSVTPNPVRRGTQIPYALHEECSVTLSIYDITGRLLTSFTNPVESAGNHKLVWTGKDDAENELASGVYFIKLDAAEESATRKIVFVR